ncbi:MAG: SAM-dependent methyltransferase, partial [Oscillospiraceae bacterium]|nr:SAM-dependent methyltransferase [Oscillospiraceae bacterium]
MNKNAIKNFAVTARVMLIDAVKQCAFEYEVTEGGKNDPAQESVNGRTLTAVEKAQRAQLIANISANGFAQTMEETAYTWFNRFIALRYMEVNNYLPSHTRLFSDGSGAFKPEALDNALDLEIDGLKKDLVIEMLEKQENERLYKYILITQCNALNTGLPEMFEKIGGWTELLFPKNLLREDSVVARMVNDIPEDDWKDQVKIIGWLYQYYNSEKKD